MSCGHKCLEALLAFAAQLKLQIPPDPRSRPLAGTIQPCAASCPAVCVRAVLRVVSPLPPDKGGSLGHRQGSHGHCARCWQWGHRVCTGGCRLLSSSKTIIYFCVECCHGCRLWLFSCCALHKPSHHTSRLLSSLF